MKQRLNSYSRQVIDEDDIAAVQAVLHSDFLTGGEIVPSFEQALCDYVSAPDMVACNSGTAALHLALAALGIGPDDTVFVPAISFVATANAARFLDASLRFVDVDPTTALMTAETLRNAIDLWRSEGHSEAVGCVIPVHFAGQSENLPQICSLARQEGASIVVDACHAIGSRYLDENGSYLPVGCSRHADAEAFSFHPVKNMTTGEGGALAIHDNDLAESARVLRSHGIIRDGNKLEDPAAAVQPWYYEMQELGFNYRLCDINAALGLSQLKKLDNFTDKRRQLMAAYHEQLKQLSPTITPLRVLETASSAWHLNVVLVDFASLGMSREEMIRQLRTAGIGTQVHYRPIPDMPYYSKLRQQHADGWNDNRASGASQYYDRALSLPLHPMMTAQDVDYVIEYLSKILGEANG